MNLPDTVFRTMAKAGLSADARWLYVVALRRAQRHMLTHSPIIHLTYAETYTPWSRYVFRKARKELMTKGFLSRKNDSDGNPSRDWFIVEVMK